VIGVTGSDSKRERITRKLDLICSLILITQSNPGDRRKSGNIRSEETAADAAFVPGELIEAVKIHGVSKDLTSHPTLEKENSQRSRAITCRANPPAEMDILNH
jgi:hypothetical protein